jgi:hypothetical protein
MMHRHGKSDSPIVLAKLPNKAVSEAAEAVEERGLAKGKTRERNMTRTQSRRSMSSALKRIRQAAASRGRSERCYHSHSLMRLGVIYPRQEPDAVMLHVRIRAGGRPRGRSLPRHDYTPLPIFRITIFSSPLMTNKNTAISYLNRLRNTRWIF